MNGVTYAILSQNETLQQTRSPQGALPLEAFDLACQPDIEAPMIDVLAELDRALDQTPEHVYLCRPLTRRTVAAAAAEIRRLRALLAALIEKEIRQ